MIKIETNFFIPDTNLDQVIKGPLYGFIVISSLHPGYFDIALRIGKTNLEAQQASGISGISAIDLGRFPFSDFTQNQTVEIGNELIEKAEAIIISNLQASNPNASISSVPVELPEPTPEPENNSQPENS